MEPVPDPHGSSRLARRVLAAAVAVQFFFFALEMRRSARAAILDPGRGFPGGAAVCGMDPHGYYAWLRSPLVDGDFDFDNEFAYCNEHWNRPAGLSYGGRTPIGRHVNQWSVGPATVWAVAVVPLDAALGALGLRGDGIEAGYTPLYQLAVGAVTFSLSVATLLLAYAVARRFARPVPSAAAAVGVTLGTPLVAYGSVGLGMAHGPAAAAVAALVYAWVRTLGSTSPARWFGLGILVGFACLMRWQLATFGVILAAEAVGSGGGRLRRAGLLLLAAGGAVVGFLPQMLAWRAVYGSPLVNPHGGGPPQWFDPVFWRVLCSSDRGLFYWTPIALVGVVGCACAVLRVERRRLGPLAVLLLAGLVQVYAIAVLFRGPITLGSSFGFRFLTETCVVLIPGLAVALDRLPSAVARGLVAGMAPLVAWNMLLLCTFWASRMPEGPATPSDLLRAVGAAFDRRPAEVVVTALAAAAFAAWFVARVVPALRAGAVPDAAVAPPAEVRRAA